MNRNPPRLPLQRNAAAEPRWRDRTPLLAAFLLFIGLVFVGRLFYVQVIKHDSYKAAATSEQFKKFSLPAERGHISVLDGDEELPVVLNETRYLLFADPRFISDASEAAIQLQPFVGGETNELKALLESDSSYVELAKKVDRQTADKIRQLELKGIVLKEQRSRTYPEGMFAAQVLGFVNQDGDGQYGLEGFYNDELAGEPGLLRAVTDIHGVPLAGNDDNVVKQPVAGKDVVLTIDATIQRIAQEAIKRGVESTGSTGGSVVILDVETGAVKGMANWPSFDPAKYEEVEDMNVFKNRAVTDPLEIGSIMKVLTVASAFDQGLVGRDSTYFDAGYEEVDGIKITNAMNFGSGNFSILEILRSSLNTGAVNMLKKMGGGSVNEAARIKWHRYLTEHYKFGSLTGIEQVGESGGIIPNPTEGDGRNIQYANTSFGQGMTVTIMQMAAAFGAVLNGGTYYQPSIIHSVTDAEGDTTVMEPRVLKSDVVSDRAAADLVQLMGRYTSQFSQDIVREGFSIGGKTGSAQILKPDGTYHAQLANGTYAGYIGGAKPKYAVVLRIDEPKISGFAGGTAARPIFNEIAKNMMDSLPFTPGR